MSEECKACKHFAEDWLLCVRLGCHVQPDDNCQHWEPDKNTENDDLTKQNDAIKEKRK